MSGFGTPGSYRGSTEDQPRLRPGAPGAGRFAATTHREPDVSLTAMTDEEYNADGSFEFPPLPRSVEQHVAFWSRVMVPDPILMRVQEAYAERWETWSKEQMAAWNVGHPDPSLARGRTDATKREEWLARRDAATAALVDQRPPTIEGVLCRTIVRATQMGKYAGWLELEADYDKVLDVEVDLGGDEPISVRDIEKLYLMAELEEQSFENPSKFVGWNAAMAVTALHEIVGRMRAEDGGN